MTAAFAGGFAAPVTATVRLTDGVPMSRVTTPTSQLAVCTQCTGTRVTHITMTLTDGSIVDFASCHVCEHKSWTEAGTGLDVSAVLRKAQKIRV